jgi:hypothetical protein
MRYRVRQHFPRPGILQKKTIGNVVQITSGCRMYVQVLARRPDFLIAPASLGLVGSYSKLVRGRFAESYSSANKSAQRLGSFAPHPGAPIGFALPIHQCISDRENY